MVGRGGGGAGGRGGGVAAAAAAGCGLRVRLRWWWLLVVMKTEVEGQRDGGRRVAVGSVAGAAAAEGHLVVGWVGGFVEGE